MLSTENHILPNSHYYLHEPSKTAQELLLCPSIVGVFNYEAGYHLHRNHFDSFLLMLITDGCCLIKTKSRVMNAQKGNLVFLDCYEEHEYGSDCAWSAIWVHFDGPMARKYYDFLTAYSNIFFVQQHQAIKYNMLSIYNTFHEKQFIDETDLSIRVQVVLNHLLASPMQNETESVQGVRSTIVYISQHFAEQIQLSDLAEMASLSPYYFSRLFSKETGMSPHQYLVATRISSAKYFLTTSNLSIKEIAYKSGFKDESCFCYSFKKIVGVTPSTYRNGTAK